MVKKFPKRIFVTSLIITVIIFAAGMILGYQLDGARTNEILTGLQGNELDTESYLVEQGFWEIIAGDNCEFSEPRLESISLQLGELGDYLNSYDQKNIFKQEEFEYLARRYFLLEIKAYTLEMDARERCGKNNTVILFFYNTEDTISQTQGLVLDRLNREDEEDQKISVYSINKDFEGDEAIKTLNTFYEITTTPTLIINGEEKIEEFINYDDLIAVLDM
jgi:hypothetical protein